MGQAAKYALLAVALVAVIALCAVYIGQIPVSEAVASFTTSVTNVISVCGSYFQGARGLLNALVGVPSLVTMCLWLVFLKPFAKMAIKVSVTVYKWINQ